MDFSLLAQSNQVMEQVGAFFATMRPETIGDILLYVVFFLVLITTFTLADGNDMASYLLYGTMILALFNLTVGQQWENDQSGGVYSKAFIVFGSQVALFLLPWVAAGAARSKKKKGKAAIPLSILAGVVGMVFVVGNFLGLLDIRVF